MGSSAHDVQHLFYSSSADTSARIFQTATITPRRLITSQNLGQSGNRFPSGVVNQSEHSEIQVEGAFDVGDLTYLLASLFDYKRDSTSGDFSFSALAGGRESTYSAPKQWSKVQSYNWVGASSGPSYEAADAVLQSMEVSLDRGADSMITSAFVAKQYQNITQPASAPVPESVGAQVIRNSDIRIGLSAGRITAITYPTQILRARWSFTDLVEVIFGFNQSDRGWTDYVQASIQPTLSFTFMADAAYLTYANVDSNTFVEISDAGNNFYWRHLARFNDVPSGPGAGGGNGNVQEVEISFMPYATVNANALTSSKIVITAATSSGDTGYKKAKTGVTALGSLGTGHTGFVPDGFDSIYYDASDDKMYLGTTDAAMTAWPQNWEPATVKINATGTEYDLTYDATENRWETATITSSPITDGSEDVFLTWSWTPATYMLGSISNPGIAAL